MVVRLSICLLVVYAGSDLMYIDVQIPSSASDSRNWMAGMEAFNWPNIEHVFCITLQPNASGMY